MLSKEMTEFPLYFCDPEIPYAVPLSNFPVENFSVYSGLLECSTYNFHSPSCHPSLTFPVAVHGIVFDGLPKITGPVKTPLPLLTNCAPFAAKYSVNLFPVSVNSMVLHFNPFS